MVDHVASHRTVRCAGVEVLADFPVDRDVVKGLIDRNVFSGQLADLEELTK